MFGDGDLRLGARCDSGDIGLRHIHVEAQLVRIGDDKQLETRQAQPANHGTAERRVLLAAFDPKVQASGAVRSLPGLKRLGKSRRWSCRRASDTGRGLRRPCRPKDERAETCSACTDRPEY